MVSPSLKSNHGAIGLGVGRFEKVNILHYQAHKGTRAEVLRKGMFILSFCCVEIQSLLSKASYTSIDQE